MKTLTKVSVALALIGSLTSVMAAANMQMGKGVSIKHTNHKPLISKHAKQQMMKHQKAKK